MALVVKLGRFYHLFSRSVSANSPKGNHIRPSVRCLMTMKIDSPEFKGIFTNNLTQLVQVFEKHGHEIRIAGGAVRDILSGKKPEDIDFATTATPDQMKDMFTKEELRMINMKGEKHGTITTRIGNENFEVTTLRIDVVTDGRHAEIEFTTDWKLDANRRDLTINSLFLGTDGTVYDYFGGVEDLHRKRVVFVGDPGTRIQEDYLRILRYFRFYGRIAIEPDSHDEATLKAIAENIAGLERITGERIWKEFYKILEGNYAPDLVKRMVEVGCAPYLGIPEHPNTDEMFFIHNRAKGLNLHPVTLLASLLKNDEEMLTFHKRCKLSSFERDLGLFILNHRSKELTLKDYQVMLLKTDGKTKDTRLHIMELLKYKFELGLMTEFSKWEMPKFPVKGNLLKEKGVPPGRMTGKVMNALKMIWIESDFQKTENELLDCVRDVLKNL